MAVAEQVSVARLRDKLGKSDIGLLWKQLVDDGQGGEARDGFVSMFEVVDHFDCRLARVGRYYRDGKVDPRLAKRFDIYFDFGDGIKINTDVVVLHIWGYLKDEKGWVESVTDIEIGGWNSYVESPSRWRLSLEVFGRLTPKGLAALCIGKKVNPIPLDNKY